MSFPRRTLASVLLALIQASCGRSHVGQAGAASGDTPPASDGIGILLDLADQALKDRRLIAPALFLVTGLLVVAADGTAFGQPGKKEKDKEKTRPPTAARGARRSIH